MNLQAPKVCGREQKGFKGNIVAVTLVRAQAQQDARACMCVRAYESVYQWHVEDYVRQKTHAYLIKAQAYA